MSGPWRVLVLSTDATLVATVRAVLSAQLPDASSDGIPPEHLRSAPDATALVLDARTDRAAAVEQARLVRAMNFGGAIALVGTPDGAAEGAQLGFAYAAPERLPEELVTGLRDGLREVETPFAEALRQARRLVAAGEVALRLQHAVNNPLAAILAEAQLMQLDPATEEQQASLERIVGMCRRMVDILRKLDGIGERKL